MIYKDDIKSINYYLRKEKYWNVYIFLLLSLVNMEKRSNFIKKGIKELEKKIRKIQKETNEKINLPISNDKKLVEMLKDIHYTELEVIERLNILIEILAIYYHIVRSDIRKLPKSIGQKDFPSKKLYNEFDYFNKQKIEDILTNFKYPDVKIFTELSQIEKKNLEVLLKKSAKNILKYFKDIYKFKENFRSIYNKYKHSLSEITGQYIYNREKDVIYSPIYVRDKEKNKIYTNIITVGFEIKEYFVEIVKKVSYILSIFIDNNLLYIINKEKKCIPRNIKFSKREDNSNYKNIKEKITTYNCLILRK